MQSVGYFNGRTGRPEDMTVPLCDRSVFFGDAVYDAVLLLGGKPFEFEAHLDRLYNSCRLAKIDFRMPREALKSEAARLLELYDGGDTALLYIQVTRGTAARRHEFPKGASPNLIMFVKPLALPPRDERASLVSFEDLRFHYCNIKTVNLLPNVFAAQKAAEEHATETLFHRGERVTEAAHSSILMLKGGVLVAPPLDEYVLPGITRAVVERLCKGCGIPVERRVFTVAELLDADEILLCSTTKNVLRVFETDGRRVGGKDARLALKIQDLFWEELRRQTGESL